VPTEGLEPQTEGTIRQENSQVAEGGQERPGASPGANPAMPGTRSEPRDRLIATVDALEAALADAITKAVAAGRFDVLPSLVAELEARRKAKSETVDLAAERVKRERR